MSISAPPRSRSSGPGRFVAPALAALLLTCVGGPAVAAVEPPAPNAPGITAVPDRVSCPDGKTTDDGHPPAIGCTEYINVNSTGRRALRLASFDVPAGAMLVDFAPLGQTSPLHCVEGLLLFPGESCVLTVDFNQDVPLTINQNLVGPASRTVVVLGAAGLGGTTPPPAGPAERRAATSAPSAVPSSTFRPPSHSRDIERR